MRLDRLFYRSLSAALLATFQGGAASGQRVIRIPDVPACDCEIQIRPYVSISDSDGRAGLAEPLRMSRTYDGRYLVVPTIDQGTLLLFDSTGTYLRQVGRKGRGPSEYTAILGMDAGRGDSTYILDTGNARITVLDPELRPVRSIIMPERGGQFAVLADQSLLILSAIASRSTQPTDRLKRMDASGRLIGSFMPQPPIERSTTVADARRHICVTPDGTIGAAHSNDYAVEIWNASGQHLRTLVREAAWFPQGQQAGPPPSPRTRPPPRLEACWFDEGGRLWTLSLVADERWLEAVTSVRPLGRPTAGVPPEAAARYWDSVVEVTDAESGILLASTRVDPRVAFFLDGGFAASYRQDQDGHPYIDIWRLELVRH